MLAKIILGLILASAVVSPMRTQAQQSDGVVSDTDIVIQSATGFKYPAYALASNTKGAVVVRIELTNTGAVAAAEALSGHSLLIPGTLAAVRTWTVKPNAQRRVILVFAYRLEGGCHVPGNTLVRVVGVNLVRVTDCLGALF